MDTFARVRASFFDKAVTAQLPPELRRALSKFGAFTRRRDKSSLKYKAGSAPAGKPPHVHRSKGFTKAKRDRKTGAVTRQPTSPLRERIFFAYDAARQSVVIGPTLGGSGSARTIEEGGNATVKRQDGKAVSVHVRPHPHTRPAFDEELKRVGGNFRNIIK